MSSLVVPGFERLVPEEASNWVRRLERTARPCGCKSGAALMIAAVLGWPARDAASGIPHTPIGVVAALLTYLAVVIASAVVGKLSGIAVGRFRHRRLRQRLAERLAAVASEGGT